MRLASSLAVSSDMMVSVPTNSGKGRLLRQQQQPPASTQTSSFRQNDISLEAS